MKIIECVPNISEGRNKEAINEILSIIRDKNSVKLLDVDIGYDTNRTVITFIGNPKSVINTAFELIKKTYDIIDMSKHVGAHPRMGATDVCPLIPVANVTMKECVKYSNELARMLSKNLDIPIYMYEESALHEDRRNLANIRNGEYEGFHEKILKDKWKPDYGKPKFNKKFGTIAIGAREFLIAYNINLNTHNKKIASDIALDIREKGRLKRNKNGEVLRDNNGKAFRVKGKFNHCKAVGWYIAEYSQAQVSINLTNYKKTPLHKVYEEVRKQARKRGVRVTGSEIVGLIPKEAIIKAGIFYVKKQNGHIGLPESDIIDISIKSLGLNDIDDFKPNDKIIENQILDKNYFSELTLQHFIDNISRPTPTPGGGSVSALLSTIGASLTSMVANLTINKKGFEKHVTYLNDRSAKCQHKINKLLKLIDTDSNSYDAVIRALRLPKKSKKDIINRLEAIKNANIEAANVPFEILELTSSILSDTLDVCMNANPNSISDIAVAAESLKAAAHSASYNVIININSIEDIEIQKKYKQKTDYYIKDVDDSHLKILKHVQNILSNE